MGFWGKIKRGFSKAGKGIGKVAKSVVKEVKKIEKKVEKLATQLYKDGKLFADKALGTLNGLKWPLIIGGGSVPALIGISQLKK